MPSASPTDPTLETLLALCSRATVNPAFYQRIQEAVQRLPNWDRLPARADAHGLAPLVQRHLAAAGVTLPPAVHLALHSYTVQHAHAAAVRTRTLTDILTAFQTASIPALVLKGAALAYLVYPEPSLRPMRDIDLLVPATAARRAQLALFDLGFVGDDPTVLPADHHHLPALKRVLDGFSVSVEIHHALDLAERDRAPRNFEQLAPTALPFAIQGVPAATLSREDTLWHLYRHTFLIHWRYEGPRLIGLADVVSLVEAWADTLDWDHIRWHHPDVFRVLPVLHRLTPWSAAVIDKTRQVYKSLTVVNDDQIGATLMRWPRSGQIGRENRGMGQTIHDALLPPTLWLRLTYGCGPSRLDLGRAWLAHLGWLLGRIGRIITRSAKNRGRTTA